VDAEIPADIRVAVWRKFIALVGLSATTMATRLPIVVREAAAVGRAAGVAIGDDLVESRLAQLDTWPAEMTSSMHQDLKRGNRLEVPWLSGAVVRLGAALGVPTPCNRVIWDVLAPWADGASREAAAAG
jgi:2-dehydropantoate 2-reductase